ncbi:MAG: hypothetical protein ACRCVN_06310 [Spirochaetia bacterium]
MANLCYLLSSLPTLSFGKSPQVTYVEFLDASSRSLGVSEYERLKAFDNSSPPVSLDGLPAFEKKYWGWEVSLRNELVRLRAEVLGVKPDRYLHNGGSLGLTTAVAREGFRESDPLRVEEFLTRARYDWLEACRCGRSFDFDILLIYSMQLQLLQRYYSFDATLGRENYSRVYQRVLSEAESVLLENIS